MVYSESEGTSYNCITHHMVYTRCSSPVSQHLGKTWDGLGWVVM